MKKICFKCGIEKDINEFYKHSQMSGGLLGKCKECTKKDVRNYYSKNKDRCNEYDQIRNQKRKDYIKKKNELYYKKNKEKISEYKKKWAGNNKQKRKAHWAVSNALRDSKLIKSPCQICGDVDVEAHHYDYSKELKVIWLCKKHHEKIHWWLRFNKRR